MKAIVELAECDRKNPSLSHFDGVSPNQPNEETAPVIQVKEMGL